MQIMNNVEFGLSKAEECLSKAAAVPVVGTFTSVAKVALGAIQTSVATTCLLLTLVPAIATRNVSWLRRPTEHILHGIMNISAGIFEGIPLLGTLLYLARKANKNAPQSDPLYASNGNDFTAPYSALIRARICGTDAALVKKANERFEEIIEGKDPTNAERYRAATWTVTTILAETKEAQRRFEEEATQATSARERATKVA